LHPTPTSGFFLKYYVENNCLDFVVPNIDLKWDNFSEKLSSMIDMNNLCTRLKYENYNITCMSMTAWHCYRCNLTFKEKSHVVMHKEISRHDAREVEIPE